jgi:MerR family transcriptional regulator, light-induced transcriptional regulator
MAQPFGRLCAIVTLIMRGHCPLFTVTDVKSDEIGETLMDWDRPMIDAPFIAPELLAEIDLPTTRERLSSIVKSAVLPRLVQMHREPLVVAARNKRCISIKDIEKLAHLVLDPNTQLSSAFVSKLEDEGHEIDDIFVNLLEPAARCLGTMWDNGECSFVDVALGVARLQQLLSMLSRSYTVPEFSLRRSVCMVTLANETHSFGAKMVSDFLRAGGWVVQSEYQASATQIAEIVAEEWFAVIGLTISSSTQCPLLKTTIAAIRARSRNSAVGIMVGGPPFAGHSEIVAEVGADATAVNAPAAVLLAQRLFDLGASKNWGE